LFVGTEFSCFMTNNGGGKWKKLGAGLPPVAVRDIAIQKRENDLVLGTFGRGFFVMDDYSPLRQISQEELAKDAQIFDIKDGLQYVERKPLGIRGNGFQGDNYWSARNPKVGATFTYFVKDGHTTLKSKRQKEEKKAIKEGRAIRYPTYDEWKAEKEEKDAFLQFTIRDKAGNIIRKIKTGLSDGSVNRMVWDGRLAYHMPVSLRPAFDNIFGNPPETGYFAMPGEYTVSLERSINGEMAQLVAPKSFKIKALDGVTLATADRGELMAFQEKMGDLQANFSAVGSQMGDINDKLRHMKKAVYYMNGSTQEFQNDIAKIEEELDAIQEEMYGDSYAGTLDKDTPYSITNRVFAAGFEMFNSTSKPTTTFTEAYRLANAGLKPLVARLQKLQSGAVKNLEEKLIKVGAPYTPGRRIDLGE